MEMLTVQTTVSTDSGDRANAISLFVRTYGSTEPRVYLGDFVMTPKLDFNPDENHDFNLEEFKAVVTTAIFIETDGFETAFNNSCENES